MKGMRPWGMGVLVAAIAAGCHESPATPPDPGDPGADPVLPAPHPPAGGPELKAVGFFFVSSPDSLRLGDTAAFVARTMLPPEAAITGLTAQPSDDGMTYSLSLPAAIPPGSGASVPREVSLAFTPTAPGTYYLESDRRVALIVTSPTTPASTGWTPSSFLDRAPSSTPGAWTAAPTPAPAPSPVAPPPIPVWSSVTSLDTLTAGAVRGNAGVLEQKLSAVSGPTSVARGQRAWWTATLWTAGEGPIGMDLVEEAQTLKVTAIIAPDPNAGGMPMPYQTTQRFSWVFRDAGTYPIVSGSGIPLATVRVD